MAIKGRTVAQWGALGALSGTLATFAIFIPDWLKFADALEGSIRFGDVGVSFAPMTIAPGLFFGLIVGHALRRRKLVSGALYAAYILAATLSYFVTVQIAINFLMDMLDNAALVGIASGAIGASLLAGATAGLMPEFRHGRPAIAMILAGTVLGVMLHFSLSNDQFLGWLLLFAPWQAGYAAAMGTAIPAMGKTQPG